jgi:hypothetical protein
MSERNGSARLTYWIMGALFAVLLMVVGGAWAELNTRVGDLEDGRNANVISIHDLQRDVQAMQVDVCAILNQAYEIREHVTKQVVYRRPCP